MQLRGSYRGTGPYLPVNAVPWIFIGVLALTYLLMQLRGSYRGTGPYLPVNAVPWIFIGVLALTYLSLQPQRLLKGPLALDCLFSSSAGMPKLDCQCSLVAPYTKLRNFKLAY